MALITPSAGVLPIVFDPDTDPLDINDGVGYRVHAELSLEPPANKPVYASSHDTEGAIPASEAHYENREIGLKVRVYGNEDEVEDRLAALYRKLGQVQRSGGVIGITTPAG